MAKVTKVWEADIPKSFEKKVKTIAASCTVLSNTLPVLSITCTNLSYTHYCSISCTVLSYSLPSTALFSAQYCPIPCAVLSYTLHSTDLHPNQYCPIYWRALPYTCTVLSCSILIELVYGNIIDSLFKLF
jgi:hypothetical protein